MTSSRIHLSESQQKVIDTWGQGIAVVAGAGCGKTTTLVSKCQALIERKPDAKICVISFTEKSIQDFKKKLGKVEPHWVMTIHGFCSRILKEFPEMAGLDGEESVLDESQAKVYWDQSVERLWHSEVPESISDAFELISEREGVRGTLDLLERLKRLSGFGAIQKLSSSDRIEDQALACLAVWVIEGYQNLKVRGGFLDYDDLEKLALRVLDHEPSRRQIQMRFDLVLIDEFQDTNQIQCEIAERLARPGKTNLVVVGDPKQSIYRFRDADVSLFDSFTARLPVRVNLSGNYRSVPEIIHLTNDLCRPLFHAREMEYIALEAMRAPSESEPGNRTLGFPSTDPADLARFLKSEMRRGIPLDEYCILLRRIRGNEALIQGLLSSGLPVVVGSGGFFWEDPRVVELVSLLRFWLDPSQRLSAARFLRAPWVGGADSAIDQKLDALFRSEDLWASVWALDFPVIQALAVLRERIPSVSAVLFQLLELESVEREVGWVVLALAHRADLLSQKGSSFEAIVQEFSKKIENHEREPVLPQPKMAGALSIMTIHGSKGLEFKRVILADLKKRSAARAPVIFWNTQKGVYFNFKDEDGERDRTSAEVVAWRSFESAKEREESMRLFYVALTRAQEQLIFVYDPTEERKGEVADSDHWTAWAKPESLPQVSIAGIEAGAMIDPASSRPEIARPSRFQLPLNATRTRFGITELCRFDQCERAAVASMMGVIPEDQDSETDRGTEERQKLGTRIHEALSRQDVSALEQLPYSSEALIRWMETTDWFEGPGRAEWGFELKVFGEVLVGAMDRLVVRSENDRPVYWVLDYKVSESRKPLAEWAQQYTAQLQWYAWVLEQIEPRAKGAVRAVLIRIQAGKVEECPVPLQSEWGQQVQGRLMRVKEVLHSPLLAKIKISSACKTCRVLKQCPEGRQSVGA